MKVAFTTSGSRVPGFIIYDIDSGTSEFVDNQQSLNAAQGAGIQAAETVVRSGAKALVTGHCGPKAFRVLCAAGVEVYNTDQPTVAAALAAFKAGTLKPADSADVEGHWV